MNPGLRSFIPKSLRSDHHVYWWNAGWCETDSSIQMNAASFLIYCSWYILSWMNVLHYFFRRFCSETSSLHLSAAVLWLVGQTRPSLFRPFARNSICEVLIGRSRSEYHMWHSDWPRPLGILNVTFCLAEDALKMIDCPESSSCESMCSLV